MTIGANNETCSYLLAGPKGKVQDVAWIRNMTGVPIAMLQRLQLISRATGHFETYFTGLRDFTRSGDKTSTASKENTKYPNRSHV